MHAEAPRQSLAADLRSLPRPFWILFAGVFINRFGTFVWPFLTIYLTRRGYSLAQASVAVSALGAGALFGGVLGGWVSGPSGRRQPVVAGAFGPAVLGVGLFAAQRLAAIV